MEEKEEYKYVVLRISNGHVNRVYLYDIDSLDETLERAKSIYVKFSKSGNVPRDFETYFNNCIKDNLMFEYPFDGNIYPNECVFVKKVPISSKRKEEENEFKENQD